MRPGLVVHTSSRLENLLDALVECMTAMPLGPMQTETIVVPGQGLARWLQLGIAERKGIASGLHLPFPGAFLQSLHRSANTGAPGVDPFDKAVLRWRLWRLLGDAAHARELGPAQRYCSDDPDGRKRAQLAQRLAQCFDDYQLYRDDLLLRAAAGDDLADLGPHAGWQAALWRTLLRDAGAAPAAKGGPKPARPGQGPLLFRELDQPDPAALPTPHRLQFLREVLGDPDRARRILPPRVLVFGAVTLPPAVLDLFGRIGEHVPVHLFVPQPTTEFTGDRRGGRDEAGNHLGSRLGQEAREFQSLLVDFEERYGCTAAERPAPTPAAPRCLLHCLQQDILHDLDRAEPGDAPRFPLRADDDSLLVHDCHSPRRELEVVRDQILRAFADDRTLAPHDVLVLVPDIEAYAPYAHAVFGPVRELVPYHIADRSPARERPLVASVFAVLQLARERLHVHDVLHLLEEPAVQRRFGLTARDLPALRSRCERAGIRWGLDGAWRQRHCRVPAFDANAWLPGLDRLVLGAATGPVDDLVLGILPVGGATASGDEQLARFVAFAHTLFGHLHELQRPHPPAEWALRLDALVADFYRPASPDDEQAVADLQQATALLRRTTAAGKAHEPLWPIVLQDWLDETLQQAAGARGFLGGSVTIAALLPMRTVPIRQLFLCGLADRTFPRREEPAVFDLVAAVRRTGDRSLRLDDRQMFLDALLAARERLHITFVGHSEKDDSECAPSVVLAELLEAIDRSCEGPAAGAAASTSILLRHPLQPWSRRYRSGEDPRLFTYGKSSARVTATGAAAEAPWADVELPPVPDGGDLALEELLAFWRSPCRHFLRERLGIRLHKDEDLPPDEEPFALDNLERWRLENDLVHKAEAGARPAQDPQALAQASGRLPVGGVGAMAFAASSDRVAVFLHRLASYGQLSRRCIDVVIDGVRVHGEIDGVGEQAIVFARIAKVKSKDLLRAFVQHAFAALARHGGAPGLPATSRVLGTDKDARLAPLDAEAAARYCRTLLSGYRLGSSAPLPFFEHSSSAYAAALAKGKDPASALAAARHEWHDDFAQRAHAVDTSDPEVVLCMRGRDPFALPAFATWATAVLGPLEDAQAK